ncbi:uncharacterized protein N7484_010997 [Penicillium longicatenatum]|uniref:uncharacterized protein n=1 Tax=Penicillium longicatenatum TaxID=1561947 RepID=UPI00254674C5|nr:uncharacterized protein N7484_010997 [Penicillium longicatenatum]KAJ5630897.1 hypothetical protein N7484_010997 [Penicillium longicatenatum]
MDLDGLARLQTEGVNPQTTDIDRVSTLEMCTVINNEDHLVAESVALCLPVIADAIDALALRVRKGGRVVYVGAGTSGRLGILDASEIPPTFAASPSQFVGLIAGGNDAIRQAQEGAEDNEQAGRDDLQRLNLDRNLDSVIGIASSGRTPYVLGCLSFAKRLGCLTIGVICTSPSAMGHSGNVDYLIAPLPGPEVVTGSTRLKAGSATKMVLNMLSTGTMIRIGKTYGNMMVDMVASNLKLEQRARNILRRLSGKCQGFSDSELDSLLARCNRSVKLAILVAETSGSVESCREALASAGGVLAKALTETRQPAQKSLPESRRFVLCIDGGGTKCAAVVANKDGVISHGFAGPCNITDNINNVEVIISALATATKAALKEKIPGTELTDSNWRECLKQSFRSVWIGLAGMDRSGLHSILAPKLGELFGLDHTTPALKLTNDVSLLTAASNQSPSVIAVIAGTGSVAMRYNRTEGQAYTCVARAGGWGHLLGDEGGGYSIGLEAIKNVLEVLEERNLGLGQNELGEFERAVIGKLGGQVEENDNIDLLSEILSQSRTQSVKSRIAGVAEAVLKLAGNSTAKAIIDAKVSSIVRKPLHRLVDPRSCGYVVPEETELVLTGGLMKDEGYQTAMREQIATLGLHFRGICVVEDVAVMAVRYLLCG